MPPSKLERLLNLTALLLDTARPLSAEEVKDSLGAYAEDHEAFRRTFERDKDELRRMGIPISIEPVPGTHPPVDGYRIARDQYALEDPALEPEELAALHLAASAVRVEGLPATEGLLKLGGLVPGSGEDLGLHLAPLPADPNLPVLFGAVAARRPVAFTYHGTERTVDPYRLDFQRGRWYLSGYDHLREDERSYRLERIEGEVRPTDGPSFTPPASAVPGRVAGAWELGADEPVTARLRIDGPPARWALHHLGPDRVVEEDGGAVVVELPVTNRDAFRSFVLSFLDHAVVLGPPELRSEIVEWLEALG